MGFKIGMRREGLTGDLATVEAFVNTLDLKLGTDVLTEQWLADHTHGETIVGVDSYEIGRAQELRESIRELLLANTGVPADPAAPGVVQAAWERASVGLAMDAAGNVRLVSMAGGADGALGEILSTMVWAMVLGTWVRLKACQNSGCQRAFYDTSKNRSRKWCAMSICGNQAKARTYRRRNRG